MKKIIISFLVSALLIFSVSADTDGKKPLSNKKAVDVKDCFEGINRATFAFNKGIDKAVFAPIARGYRKLPTTVRHGTENVINNLSNVVTIPNNLLQGDLKQAGANSVRFVVNTTVGILGLFDVATPMGLKKYVKEDYGQTFGKWGVNEGCYLVLPILGPSTARDTVGSLVNFVGGDAWYNVTVKNDTGHVSDFDYYSSRGAASLDYRAKNLESFENLEKNSMDFYASVRSLYLQDRNLKISNSNKVVETLDDSDWEEIESQ